MFPMEGKTIFHKGHAMKAHQVEQQAFVRLEERQSMGTAAWRLLMPPVSVKRKVTVLVMDEFVGSSFPTVIQASTDNNTSVIAIKARDFCPDTAEGRVIALVRLSKQSIIKTKGSLWSNERGQACVVFDVAGNPCHMRISHQGKLRLFDGPPKGDLEGGIRTAAARLLKHMAANDDTPGCRLNYRLPAI